jgi:nitroreductase
LWAAFGINRPDGKRTAPSSRDNQETDLYVFLKTGVYTYDALANQLVQISDEDIRYMAGRQDFVKDAPVQIVLVADLLKIGDGSNDEKLYTANIDAGYISQNIYLFCTSEGLATGARAFIDKEALSLKLKLRPDQKIIIAHSVGYPGSN